MYHPTDNTDISYLLFYLCIYIVYKWFWIEELCEWNGLCEADWIKCFVLAALDMKTVATMKPLSRALVVFIDKILIGKFSIGYIMWIMHLILHLFYDGNQY